MSFFNPAITPHYTSLLAEPLTAAEIDEHVDCARIWATLVAMREEANEYIAESQEDADAYEKELEQAQQETAQDEVIEAIMKLKSGGFKKKDLRKLYELVGLEL